MDRLSTLLSKFPIRARRMGENAAIGSLHLQEGQLHVAYRGVSGFVLNGHHQPLSEPSVILIAPGQPIPIFEATDEAMIASAWLEFDGGMYNPIAKTLPADAMLPISVLTLAEGAIGWLAIEATHQHCGRDVALSSLRICRGRHSPPGFLPSSV